MYANLSAFTSRKPERISLTPDATDEYYQLEENSGSAEMALAHSSPKLPTEPVVRQPISSLSQSTSSSSGRKGRTVFFEDESAGSRRVVVDKMEVRNK